ncbi:MAG TPA: hypothetical protein VFU89_03090 [Rhabdochlamydiaceae bacterium]|nr:hypothetical protein [Rhabdochlamydiaceae bacterium]
MVIQVAQAALCVLFLNRLEYASAKAYGATEAQAGIFSAITSIVESVLVFSANSFVQNSRELALATVLIKTTSGITGALVTQLFCENEWKQAVACIAFPSFAAMLVSCIILHPPVLIPKL